MSNLKPEQIPGAECPACLERLADQALAGLDLEPELEAALRAEISEITRRGLAQGDAPAFIASEFFALARQRTNGADPFAAKKAADFAAAREAVARLGQTPDNFAARAKMAIMGNALDHFFLADVSRLWEQGGGLELGRDDLARAEARLAPGARVVILADNCGEQAFDRLLAQHLLGRGCEVHYVVKAGPVQNDLSLADLNAANENFGLGRVRGIAPPAVGLDPEAAPQELRELLAGAALVVAKGMGHFETLGLARGMLEAGRAPWPLLMLFLAKCAAVARRAGVEKGQGVALFIPSS
ncbi:MAG: DUF89 family protein [Proteobacteria bacterium]|nr:DUF89 family protein [Pseudomonadota bacterium]MBU1451779.1 DUF89 family protein [Pseudomonadota bacterium]MBU2468528.1 DUF89 family protein [Pseudomonadota bacterium]MBU2519156.1 DUF89 family protein [Pseudomonadota bacterium]